MADFDDWPFAQAPNVASISDAKVLDGAPILLVTHYDDDDSWAFLCGGAFDMDDAKVIGMGTALKLDPTLRAIADLPPGWSATRQEIGSDWERTKDE